uniref:UPAR/Ly6 domain-containing protein n=1 Tax=Salvator merianae TaxID=96440 RepID=A0A8D0BUU9_SALMN
LNKELVLVLKSYSLLQTEALKCHVCKHYHRDLGCIRGEGICEAEPGQYCKYIRYFKGKYFKGCTAPGDICNALDRNGDLLSTTSCCNYQDFCEHQEETPNWDSTFEI